jgi:hypothetical protein
MSFEGYYQVLCKQGHYETFSVYHMDPEDWLCSACGSGAKWWNLVDLTNGSYDDDGTRIDGYVYIEGIEFFPCKCNTCGVVHYTSPAVYKLPEKGKGYIVA